MDIQLLDKLIKIIKNYKSDYNNLNKLILTFNDDELNYFLNNLNDIVFSDNKLTEILINTIPKKFNIFINEYLDKKIKDVDYDLALLEIRFKNGEVNESNYKELSSNYKLIKSEIIKIKNDYIFQILNILKNK